MKEKTMKEIKGLTGLRGYAALWVFFLHATWGWPVDSYAMNVARLGGSGLTIFFVLSGFILSYVYADLFKEGRVTYTSFMRARIARVYPLHIFTLLLFAGLANGGYAELGENDTFYTFLLNVGLVQSWGFTQLVSWNQPAWSISTEMFAYLLFPVITVWVSRANGAVLAALLAFLFYCLLQSPYAMLVAELQKYGILDVGGKQFAHGSSLVQLFYVFCLRVVLYSIAVKAKPALRGASDLMTLAGCLLLIYWCGTETVDLALWQSSLCASLIIIPLYYETKLSAALFGNPVAHYLGKISYALYLTALMSESVAKRFMYPVPLIVNLALSLIVAALLHHLIEVPVRRWIVQKSKSKDAATITPA